MKGDDKMSRLNRRELLGTGLLGISAATCAQAVRAENPDGNDSSAKLAPLLTFFGNAESAIKRYVSLFKNSKLVTLDRYGAEGPGTEGTVRIADFILCGQRILCIDSPIKHEWNFTPAISLYVEDPEVAVIKRYFETLSNQGQVLMPLAEYPFSKQFGWVQDQFGVSWQLSAVESLGESE